VSVEVETRLRRGPLAALRGLLYRPLASYYLLLSSAGLLLVIGLVMVFSATAVQSYAADGNAYASVSRQALFALLGLVAFWFFQRLPARTYRALGTPLLFLSIALLVLLDLVGVLPGARIGPIHGDATNNLWLYLGPVELQPSELAKLALALWGANVLVAKGRAIGRWRDLSTPLFPVAGVLFLLVGYNDFGTMVCLLILFAGLLWAAGVRLRVFAGLAVVALAGFALLITLPGFRYRMVTPPTATANPRAIRACTGCTRSPTGAGSASGSARGGSSGAGYPTATTTSSSRSSPTNSVWWAASWCSPCCPCSRTPACASPAGSMTRSAGWSPPASPSGWSARPPSTSAASSGCCRSPACRCRSSPTGDPP